jgi:hypothetical protein
MFTKKSVKVKNLQSWLTYKLALEIKHLKSFYHPYFLSKWILTDEPGANQRLEDL